MRKSNTEKHQKKVSPWFFLPGVGPFVVGRKSVGLMIGIIFYLFLTVVLWKRKLLFSIFSQRPFDLHLAFFFCFLVLISSWVFSFLYSLRVRKTIERNATKRIALQRFKGHPLAVVGLFCIGILLATALLSPVLAPFDPNAQEDIVLSRYLSPSLEHPFGTDKFGRDVFSRVLYGSRISISISFSVVLIAVLVGSLYGGVSGYLGGTWDNLMMRFVDFMLAFPAIFLIVTLVAIFGSKLWLLIVILSLTGWMGVARLVRGEVLSLKERDFIQAARVLGLSKTRIILRHLIPNCISPIIVAATLRVGVIILIESALSFLGLGVQPPTASWGSIINDGRSALLNAWWISTFPGLAIVITVMSFNLVGDGLREALDPRWRK